MRKQHSILLFLIFILASCQNTKSKRLSPEPDNNHIALVKKMLKEGDNKNPSYLEDICHPNYKYYLPSNNDPLSLEEHRSFWESVNLAFPDLTHHVQDIFGVDEMVVARVTVTGTHQGEFSGIKSTGKKVEVSQIFICRFENNKLIELREEVDLLGLYKQLGMELQFKE